MSRLAELLTRRQRLVGLCLGLLTFGAILGLSRLNVDERPRSIYRSADAEYLRMEEVFENFGSDDNDCLVLLEGIRTFSPQGSALLRLLDERLEALACTSSVLGPQDVVVFDPLPRGLLPGPEASPEAFELAEALAREHPLVHDQLVSPDGSATLVFARLAGSELELPEIREAVNQIRATARAVYTELGLPGVPLVTGVPPLRLIIFDTVRYEQALLSSIGAVLSFLVGGLLFRRFRPIAITSSASILAGMWALGAMGLWGESVNLLNASLPTIIMVIALTDAVHLMFDVLHSRRRGAGRREASREAIRHLGLPCFLTSLTTAIGFGTLGISHIQVIQRFGITFALAVGLTFIAVVVFVPWFSAWFLKEPEQGELTPEDPLLASPLRPLLERIMRRSRLMAAAGVALTGLLTVVALQLRPENQLTESTPDGSEPLLAFEHIEQLFGGAIATAVQVEWPQGLEATSAQVESVFAAAEAALDSNELTRGTLSPRILADMLPGGDGLAALERVPESIRRTCWRPDLNQALVTTRVPDVSSRVAKVAYDDMQARLDMVAADNPGFELNLTGTGVVARRNIDVMIVDFSAGLGLAAIGIFLVLTIAFRSWRMGLVAVIPNAFPLVLAAATLVLFGLELQMASAIAFTICLGIAVDDTVHLLARYRRELDAGHSPEEAAVRAVLAVGQALVVTTAILLVGFGVICLSSIATTRLFALLCCTGIVAALIGDLLFLPALLVLFVRPRERASRSTEASL